jgi:hypothetical protein
LSEEAEAEGTANRTQKGRRQSAERKRRSHAH